MKNLLKLRSLELARRSESTPALLGLVDSGQWTRRFAEREDRTQSRADWYGSLAARKAVPLGGPDDPTEAAAIAIAASSIAGAQLDVLGGLAHQF